MAHRYRPCWPPPMTGARWRRCRCPSAPPRAARLTRPRRRSPCSAHRFGPPTPLTTGRRAEGTAPVRVVARASHPGRFRGCSEGDPQQLAGSHMTILRRVLVTLVVPALILAVFAVSSVAAGGASGKQTICHWANHKCVRITVSGQRRPRRTCGWRRAARRVRQLPVVGPAQSHRPMAPFAAPSPSVTPGAFAIPTTPAVASMATARGDRRPRHRSRSSCPASTRRRRWGCVVEKAMRWLASSGRPGEVVVIDNGSTDRSVELAEAAGARVVHERRRGYGQAYLRGFAEARGDYIVMGDSDDTYDFSDLGPLVAPLDRGDDRCSATGSRAASRLGPCPGHIGTSARRSSTSSSASSSARASVTGEGASGRSAAARSSRDGPARERDGARVRDDRQRVPRRPDDQRGAGALRDPAWREQAQHGARRLAAPALPAARRLPTSSSSFPGSSPPRSGCWRRVVMLASPAGLTLGAVDLREAATSPGRMNRKSGAAGSRKRRCRQPSRTVLSLLSPSRTCTAPGPR